MENHGRDDGFGFGGAMDSSGPKSLGGASCAQGTPVPYATGMAKEQKSQEVRVIDPISGGQKGSKIQRFSLIPRDFIWALATHYGMGAKKYADRNWEKGYAWGLTLDAHDRHFGAWLHGTEENGWVPEDNDPETGSSHLICAIWHLVALWWFHRYGRGTDNIRHTIGPVNAYKGCSIQSDPSLYPKDPCAYTPPPVVPYDYRVNATLPGVSVRPFRFCHQGGQCSTCNDDQFRLCEELAIRHKQQAAQEQEQRDQMKRTQAERRKVAASNTPLLRGASENPVDRDIIEVNHSVPAGSVKPLEEGSYRITVERERY